VEEKPRLGGCCAPRPYWGGGVRGDFRWFERAGGHRSGRTTRARPRSARQQAIDALGWASEQERASGTIGPDGVATPTQRCGSAAEGCAGQRYPLGRWRKAPARSATRIFVTRGAAGPGETVSCSSTRSTNGGRAGSAKALHLRFVWAPPRRSTSPETAARLRSGGAAARKGWASSGCFPRPGPGQTGASETCLPACIQQPRGFGSVEFAAGVPGRRKKKQDAAGRASGRAASVGR